MKLRINRNSKALKMVAAGSFAFFLIKGLVWLAIGAFATAAVI